MIRVCSILIFFFQAEDGIRDLTVTGVQTCALPISLVQMRDAILVNTTLGQYGRRYQIAYDLISAGGTGGTTPPPPPPPVVPNGNAKQIGRASCRERV